LHKLVVVNAQSARTDGSAISECPRDKARPQRSAGEVLSFPWRWSSYLFLGRPSTGNDAWTAQSECYFSL